MNESRGVSEGREAATDVVLAAASAIPILGGPLQGVYQARTNHLLRKRVAFLEQIVRGLDNRVERLETALHDDSTAEVIEGALSAVGRLPVGSDSFRLLTEIVTAVILDPGNLPRAQLLVDVVGQLLPVHLDLLRQLGPPHFTAEGRRLPRDIRHGLARDVLARSLGERINDIDMLLARLSTLGLARESVTQPGSGVRTRNAAGNLVERPGSTIRSSWVLTPFGAELLDHLADAEQVGVTGSAT